MNTEVDSIKKINEERVRRLRSYVNAVNANNQKDSQDDRVKKYADKINEKENK